VCVDVDRVREANAQQLRHELSKINFKHEESVDDFSVQLDTLTTKFHIIGDRRI
jgi:hypothetical protein